MTDELPKACRCYGAFDAETGRQVAFMGVIFQMSHSKRRVYRVSRLVVLPDYQGCGIGRRFLDAVAQQYVDDGHRFTIVTSARNLSKSLARSTKWKMKRHARKGRTGNMLYGSRGGVVTNGFEYQP